MLLTSNSHCRNIIIGKFLCAVWGGTSFQIFQILTMFTIMYQMNNPLLYLFSIEVFIVLPLITFLMGSVVLLISTILQDEKTSDFVSMLLSLFVGSAALSMYIYSNAILNLYESITLFAFFVELKEKKQSRWLFQSQICRIWALNTDQYVWA